MSNRHVRHPWISQTQCWVRDVRHKNMHTFGFIAVIFKNGPNPFVGSLSLGALWDGTGVSWEGDWEEMFYILRGSGLPGCRNWWDGSARQGLLWESVTCAESLEPDKGVRRELTVELPFDLLLHSPQLPTPIKIKFENSTYGRYWNVFLSQMSVPHIEYIRHLLQ